MHVAIVLKKRLKIQLQEMCLRKRIYAQKTTDSETICRLIMQTEAFSSVNLDKANVCSLCRQGCLCECAGYVSARLIDMYTTGIQLQIWNIQTSFKTVSTTKKSVYHYEYAYMLPNFIPGFPLWNKSLYL